LTATSVEPSGCTAVVVLIVDDMIYCANAGDSRAVFSSSGIAIPLSYDHKPTLSSLPFFLKLLFSISIFYFLTFIYR